MAGLFGDYDDDETEIDEFLMAVADDVVGYRDWLVEEMYSPPEPETSSAEAEDAARYQEWLGEGGADADWD